MNKFSIIYILAFFLFLFNGPVQNRKQLQYMNFYSQKKEFLFKKQTHSLDKKIHDKKILNLFKSFTVGNKKGLDKEVQKKYQMLGISHLFTPSGIHLSSFLLFFYPLSKLLHQKKKRFYLFIASALFLFPYFFLSGYYSIRRILLLKFFNLILKKFRKYFSYFSIFILTFSIDFLFGTYHESPVSFIYSFLFLGIIFSISPHPKLFFFLGLLSGQVLINFFQLTPINFLGSILGLFLTAIFAFIFPVIFCSFIFAFIFPTTLGEFSIRYFNLLVDISYQHALSFPKLFMNLPVLLLILSFNLRIKPFLKKMILIMSLLLYAYPLLNAHFYLDIETSINRQIRPFYNKALSYE